MKELDEIATWLLRVGYGLDFAYFEDDVPLRAPVALLEAMVRVAAKDPDIADNGDEAEAYYVLSAEIGDWR